MTVEIFLHSSVDTKISGDWITLEVKLGSTIKTLVLIWFKMSWNRNNEKWKNFWHSWHLAFQKTGVSCLISSTYTNLFWIIHQGLRNWFQEEKKQSFFFSKNSLYLDPFFLFETLLSFRVANIPRKVNCEARLGHSSWERWFDHWCCHLVEILLRKVRELLPTRLLTTK